jgi:hypothetical protein
MLNNHRIGEISSNLVTLVFIKTTLQCSPGSCSGPSPTYWLWLLLNKPKGRAHSGPGFGLGPPALLFTYLENAQAQAQFY